MPPAQRFLSLAPERRALAFEQAATQRALDVVLIEKDFWVCWLLAILFSEPALAPHLVFKGGTSLSKVFGVIDRFSEDVDLSVAPAFVGADTRVFETLDGRTQRDAAVAEMQRLCCVAVRDIIAPVLEAAICSALGARVNRGSWLRFEIDTQAHSPNLHFSYPAGRAAAHSYVLREVKLELGSLTDQQPVAWHAIQPWVAEEFPGVFDDWHCEVIALDLSRTFWEKVTILHAEYYRPGELLLPGRYARHYADVARLVEHSDAATFMADKALCARVADWKSRVFARGWARYDLARHGTLRLVPPDHRHAAVARDYAAMRPMFLREPPSFAHVIERLAAAEAAINLL